MISVDAAMNLVLENLKPLGIERVGLLEGLGRVLAERLIAPSDIPIWDNSAMDGYAIRSQDSKGASESGKISLEVIEEIPAGGFPNKRIGSGQASRILTGAPLPEGADAVIRQEETRGGNGRVVLLASVEPGENIRPHGEDVRSGQVVFEPGTSMGPSEIGLMAAMGRSLLSVYPRPRVAILSTGDELAEADEEMAPNRIRDSNSYALAAQVIEAGGIPVRLGIARDRRDSLKSRLEEGMSADLILISGGVSVGTHDYVRDVLEQLGATLKFWKVAMKPGEPLAFGMLGKRAVFGLPGNPVSVMVTFEEFVRPALRKMQGHVQWFRPVVEAVLMEPITKPVGKTHFMRAVVRMKADRYEVCTTGRQGSGLITSMVKANGLIILPPEIDHLSKGDPVRVQLLKEIFSSLAPSSHHPHSAVEKLR